MANITFNTLAGIKLVFSFHQNIGHKIYFDNYLIDLPQLTYISKKRFVLQEQFKATSKCHVPQKKDWNSVALKSISILFK